MDSRQFVLSHDQSSGVVASRIQKGSGCKIVYDRSGGSVACRSSEVTAGCNIHVAKLQSKNELTKMDLIYYTLSNFEIRRYDIAFLGRVTTKRL